MNQADKDADEVSKLLEVSRACNVVSSYALTIKNIKLAKLVNDMGGEINIEATKLLEEAKKREGK